MNSISTVSAKIRRKEGRQICAVKYASSSAPSYEQTSSAGPLNTNISLTEADFCVILYNSDIPILMLVITTTSLRALVCAAIKM